MNFVLIFFIIFNLFLPSAILGNECKIPSSKLIPNAGNNITFQLRESSLKSSTARLRKLIRINPIRINLRSAISAALTRSNVMLFPAFGITRIQAKKKPKKKKKEIRNVQHAPDPDWMEFQISSDLAAFQEITLEKLDLTEKYLLDRNHKILRCRIVNGVIDYRHNINPEDFRILRVQGFQRLLEKLSRYFQLPNLDFIISFEDAFFDEFLDQNTVPIFAISKKRGQAKIILYPEIHNYPSVDSTYHEVLKASAGYALEKKIPKAIWRGSTTGGFYSLENWMDFPRSKLVLFAKDNSAFLDCAFSSFCQGPENVSQQMHNANLFAESIPIDKQIGYKYLVAVDGNSFPSSQKWQLFSGSVLLKNESDFIEWFDSGLIPYKHYVPYKQDCSDIIDKILWLEQNPHIAKGIAFEAKRFATNNLMSSQIELYVYKLLCAYAALQR